MTRSQRQLTYGPGEPALLAVGEVRMVEEETPNTRMSSADALGMVGVRRWPTRRARSSDMKSDKSARDGARVHAKDRVYTVVRPPVTP